MDVSTQLNSQAGDMGLDIRGPMFPKIWWPYIIRSWHILAWHVQGSGGGGTVGPYEHSMARGRAFTNNDAASNGTRNSLKP